MAKFKVTILESKTHDYEIEADNEDQAKDLAMAEFENDDSEGDYLGADVIEVEPVEDEEEG